MSTKGGTLRAPGPEAVFKREVMKAKPGAVDVDSGPDSTA